MNPDEIDHGEPGHMVMLTLHHDLDPPHLTARAYCRHDPDDTTRPCWPHDEAGHPYPHDHPHATDCTYDSWVDNIGTECLELAADVHIHLPLAGHFEADAFHGTLDVGHFVAYADPCPRGEHTYTEHLPGGMARCATCGHISTDPDAE